MTDLKDGHGQSNKETPQEAENDFDDVDFDINIFDDDDIQEITNHRESSKTDGEPTVAKTSDSEPKANRTTCSGNEVAKVAKLSDIAPKRHSKHNADRTMPNENEESNITKPAQLKCCCKQTIAQPMNNDGQEMHAVSSEIESSSKVNTKAAATSKVVSDKPHKWRWRIKKPSKRDTVFKEIDLANPQKIFMSYALSTISKCFGLIISQTCYSSKPNYTAHR